MEPTRALSLRRETIAELGTDELRQVVGANAILLAHTLDPTCITCQTSLNGRCDS